MISGSALAIIRAISSPARLLAGFHSTFQFAIESVGFTADLRKLSCVISTRFPFSVIPRSLQPSSQITMRMSPPTLRGCISLVVLTLWGNMNRQHSAPLVITANGACIEVARQISLGSNVFSESAVQDLVHRFPQILPIAEIDPLFVGAVPICRELVTPAGPIDNFMVTASGLPVLVECKLWRNPEARREVIGQILDYSKELTRWSSSDLQREASRKLGRPGNPLLDLVRAAGHEVDEITFNDALTFNLRRGRFLLLIVGDGIREGVEAIAEYLQAHAGLHFTLGLVELPIYEVDGGNRILVPRVLARTQNIVRTVVAAPEGYSVTDREDDEEEQPDPLDPERDQRNELRRIERCQFWRDFLATLHLDDPEQMVPAASKAGHLVFRFQAQSGLCWLSVYRAASYNTVGLFLSFTKGSIGERVAWLLADQAEALKAELPEATIDFSGEKPQVWQRIRIPNFDEPSSRAAAIEWLQTRTNEFVNALRPRVRSALQQLENG